MTNTTKNLHPNTIAFHCLEPQVAALILDVIDSIVSILRWRQCSRILLSAIISRIAETGDFECSHAEFSFALWPDKKEPSREDKFGKWLAKFKEDMDLSNCKPVDIPKPRIDRRADGQFRSKPTLYLIGNFWKIFRAVQDAGLECDLLRMEKKPRRLRVRAIVNKYLRENGAVKIIRERKEKGEREERDARASDSSECRKPCAHCSLKDVVRDVDVRPVIVRTAREDLEAVYAQIGDLMFQAGQMNANLGMSTGQWVQKLEKVQNVEELRLRDAIKRANKSGLRLVGGQPK